MSKKWFNCHNHTEYSNLRLLDSTNHPKDLINKAIELGLSGICITDHEALCAHVEINKIATELRETNPDFVIGLGNEIYLTDTRNHGQKYYHFILIAKDAIGHKALRELSSTAWYYSYMDRGMERVPTLKDELTEIVKHYKGHLIATSACIGGELSSWSLLYAEALKVNDQKMAIEFQKEIQDFMDFVLDLFGDDFYIECAPSNKEDQMTVNSQLFKIATAYNVKMVIGTDSHYLTKEDRMVHKAYLNSQDKEREVDAFYATAYLMDTDDLEEHLDLTREELDTAYENILKINEKCEDYSILKPLKIPSLKWKTYYSQLTTDWIEKIPMLKTFNESDFVGDRELVKAILDGIVEHSDLQNQESYDEINSNLEMTWVSSNVNKAHWSAYYLNLQQIIDLCWEAGSLVGPGRGSGVGFILLYVLGITQINPLREKTRTFAWRLTVRFKGLLCLVTSSK